MFIEVKNIHGTSDNKPTGYSSWKDYWEAKSGKSWPTYCCARGCYERASLAGHVKKVGGTNEWYLVPICYSHNNRDTSYYVEESMMVKVN